MAPLTHPSIKDGWFREISSQWPGQAMTLKVKKILWVEKSSYQDVLVFESETYGNVLVLDGVIQCTERDEFSYQEMIAHLPLASHPNPKHVLVIGGGDGGVVREVLKHGSVEHVVLCDIDEAVVRVSKKYLPHMSELLTSPKVTVHIGDGFAFLKSPESQEKYDVIITDSSDPVGPAAALFSEPYFQLIHNALAPGGHCASQGECLWINLDLIKRLREDTKKIFATTEYAFTTIPTYPSGQIGFTMGAKAPGRDLKKPLRKVTNCIYYNEDVHKAAFVLPEFGRAILEEGRNLLPALGPVADAATATGKKRKVLLLGSGYVAKPCAEFIVRNPNNSLTIACRTLASAERLCQGLPNASPISLDVANNSELEAQIAAHDLVVSLIPYIHHAAVIRAAIKSKTNVVTTSYVSDAMRALEEDVQKAGVVVMNEIGLDPGIDHLYAVKVISEVHAKGGKIKEFHSYCGGLPSPASVSSNPLGYKFSWSARGVLLALLNTAHYLHDNQTVTINGADLMSHAKTYYISPPYAFVAYPNRNSVPFTEFYKIPEATTVVRGTLRYQGFPEIALALTSLGWLSTDETSWLKEGGNLTWADVFAKLIGASDTSEKEIIAQIDLKHKFQSSAERSRILSAFRWLGLFSTEKVKIKGSPLDTLCAKIESMPEMLYQEGEQDMVLLQHKFVVEWKDGKEDVITSTLERHGDRTPAAQDIYGTGYSAMAYTVGVPCGIACQLVLDGVINKPGVHAPYDEELCSVLREAVEKEGITMVERVL